MDQKNKRPSDEMITGTERDEQQQGGLPEAAVGQAERQRMGVGESPDESNMDIGSRDDESTRGLSEDELGERDTEIRRDTETHNATAVPFDDEKGGKKVTRENDLFRREGDA